jgi:hypothetical protein
VEITILYNYIFSNSTRILHFIQKIDEAQIVTEDTIELTES